MSQKPQPSKAAGATLVEKMDPKVPKQPPPEDESDDSDSSDTGSSDNGEGNGNTGSGPGKPRPGFNGTLPYASELFGVYRMLPTLSPLGHAGHVLTITQNR